MEYVIIDFPQLLMNEFLSYWSTDKKRMFTFFHSLLLWAEGKPHRIPIPQKLKKDDVVRKLIKSL